VVALAVALLAVGGVYLLLGVSEVEADIEAGRLEEARAGVEQLAKRKGEADPEVLYLRGRLRQEKRRRGQGGSAWEVMNLYSRAVAAGSGDALRELERLGRSEECEVRELAARALADSGSHDALPALRDISDREPEPPADDGEEPLRRVQRFFRLDGRCAASEVARHAIRDIEGRP
jgi:hypothetical protein